VGNETTASSQSMSGLGTFLPKIIKNRRVFDNDPLRLTTETEELIFATHIVVVYIIERNNDVAYTVINGDLCD